MTHKEWPRYIVVAGFFTWAFFEPWGITGAEIGLGISLLGTILDVFINRKTLKVKASWIPAFLFLLWSLRSSISTKAAVGLNSYPHLWILLMFLISAIYLDGEISARSVLTLFLLSLSVCAVYSIIQHYTGLDLMHHDKSEKFLKLVRDWRYQVVGTYTHHLTLANVMLLGAVLAFGRAIEFIRRARFFWLISGLLMATAMLFTFTHGPLVGFIAGICVLAILVDPKRAIFVLAGVALLALLLLALSDNFRYFILHKWSDRAHAERLYVWKASLKLVREHPIFGVGAGNFREQITPLLKDVPIHISSRAHAHNTFLQYAVEFGLVGAGLIIWLFSSLLVSGIKRLAALKRAKDRSYLELAGYIAAVSGLLVSGLTQHVLGDAEVAIICWLLCGIISAKSEGLSEGVSSERVS